MRARTGTRNQHVRHALGTAERSKKVTSRSSRNRSAISLTRASRTSGSSATSRPQLRERIARAQVPLDAVEPLTRPAHRQVVPDHPERQVIGRDIRPRQDDQDGREREEGAVDRQPAPVPVVIHTEAGAEHLEGSIRRHVDGIPGDGGLLASEVPEQPLFGDAFGNPPQRRAFEALVAREAVCFVGDAW